MGPLEKSLPKDMGCKPEFEVPLVLVVDDDLTTALTLEGLLQGAGLEAILASTIAEAESILLGHPVELVLLDVHLPDGNGLDLCRKWTKVSSVPILFISGDGDIATKIEGFSSGGVDYITKPLSGPEVLARVRTHLRLRAAQKSLIELQAERIKKLSTAQQRLMARPEDLPHAGFQVCIRQVLQAGGDFYDVITLGSRIVDFIVADASGHDLGVSLWTASFKALLSDCVSAITTPMETFRSINGSLRRVLPEGIYFTALHARLERNAKKLTIVNAAHPPAILINRTDRKAHLLQQEGDILGIFEDALFDSIKVTVHEGDRLYLYTDGLVEMGGSREEGYTRAMEACQRAASLPLAESVNRIVSEMTLGKQPDDDIVLLGVEI